MIMLNELTNIVSRFKQVQRKKEHKSEEIYIRFPSLGDSEFVFDLASGKISDTKSLCPFLSYERIRIPKSNSYLKSDPHGWCGNPSLVTLRPGLDVELHMRRIKYPLVHAAFVLDNAFHMCQIEFSRAGNAVMGIIKFSFPFYGKPEGYSL